MTTKTITGAGKLYDGDTYMCDVKYDMNAREIQHGRDTVRWDVTGSLSGLDPHTANRIGRHRDSYVLHLSDGTQQNIAVQNRDALRRLCRIRFRAPIVWEFE